MTTETIDGIEVITDCKYESNKVLQLIIKAFKTSTETTRVKVIYYAISYPDGREVTVESMDDIRDIKIQWMAFQIDMIKIIR